MNRLLLPVKLLRINNFNKLNKTADIVVNQVDHSSLQNIDFIFDQYKYCVLFFIQKAIKDQRFALPLAKMCLALENVRVAPIFTEKIILKTYMKDLIISKCLNIFNMEYKKATNENDNIDLCISAVTKKVTYLNV